MKIKIVEMSSTECDYVDWKVDEATTWEEVSQEELEAIQLWADDENRKSEGYWKIVIIREKQIPDKKTIASYLEKAKKRKEEIIKKEQKRKEKEESRQEKAIITRLRSEEKKREKKLTKLQELKEDLGVQ